MTSSVSVRGITVISLGKAPAWDQAEERWPTGQRGADVHDGQVRCRPFRAEAVRVRDDKPLAVTGQRQSDGRLAYLYLRQQRMPGIGAQRRGREAEHGVAPPGGHPHDLAVR